MNPDEFDLNAWVADTAPTLLDAESAEGWAGTKPVTELMAEGGPLAAYLTAPAEPSEEAGRSGRAEFWESRRAAEQAAREAALDAAQHHAGLANGLRMRAAVDAFNAHQARAGKAAKEDEEGPRVPVKGPDQPTEIGRW